MLDRDTVIKKVVKIISDYTEIKVKNMMEEKHLVEDLGLSSFDMIYLISEIEDKFQIEINITEEFADVVTVLDLCNYILKLIEENND